MSAPTLMVSCRILTGRMMTGFCLWGCAVSLAFAQAQALTIAVRDTKNGVPVAGELACGIGERTIKLDSRQTGMYVSKIAARAGELLSVRFSAASNYGERDVTVQVPRGVRNLNLVLHVARKRPQYPYQYLDEGLAFQSRIGDFDRALAHFEIAYFAATAAGVRRATQYDVKLKYNYAMALANACLRANYATCDEARRMLSEMKRDAPGHADFYNRERISQAEIERTIQHLETNQTERGYAEFKALFDGSEYVAAAQLGENLLKQSEQGPNSIYAAGLSKDRLREDLGTAYFRAAELTDTTAEPAQQRGLYEKARNQFVSVQKKPETVIRALRALDARL